MNENTQHDDGLAALSETATGVTLPADDADTFMIAQGLHAEFSGFAGPLPPPEILDRYEQVFPGAARRIFEMAESQAMHRKEMDKKSLYLAGRDAAIGVIFGFIIALIGIGGGMLVIAFNPNSTAAVLTGGVISSSTLVGIVRIFVTGNKKSAPEKSDNN